jgi:hypothetical protein
MDSHNKNTPLKPYFSISAPIVLFSTGIVKVIMIGFEGGRHVVNSRTIVLEIV